VTKDLRSSKGLGEAASAISHERRNTGITQVHGQFICARFRGLVAESCLQKFNVSTLMSGDLLEPAIRPIGEACVNKILLRELGETLRIEGILDVLQSEGKIQDINVCRNFTVKGNRNICWCVHSPLGEGSRGRGLATARVVRMVREKIRNLRFIVEAKEGSKRSGKV